MALTLVADIGADDANSYAEIAEADAQAEATVGPSAAAWVAGTDDEAKKRALISATRTIDALEFIGERATTTQRLEWPRTDAITPTGREYDSDALPPRLVAATIELAINYLANETSDVLNPVANDKKRIRVEGEVDIEYFEPPTDSVLLLDGFPESVRAYLLSLVVTAMVAGVWGGSTQERVS